MMSYHKLSMKDSPRAAHFAYFQTVANPYLSVTEEIDITQLRKAQREWEDPFFLTMNYCASRAADRLPQFRQRVLGDEVVEYDHCISSHTVLLPDETYTYCETDASLPFDEYLREGQKKQADVIAAHAPPVDEDPLCPYFVSSLPWRNLKGLQLPTPIPADSNPRISWAKFYEKDGRVLLPVFVMVHHGLADGIHVCRFLDYFEEEIASYCRDRFQTRP